MASLVPEWRLREIRNIADTLAYRAACCPVSRLLMLAQEKYLKPNTHIRLLIHPGLKVGEASSYIQHFQEARNIDAGYSIDLFEVTIYFNGDLSTKKNWEKITRAIVKELGWVIFFSAAAKRLVIVPIEKAFLKDFVNEVWEEHPFTLDSTRPRFTLAKLQQIVKEERNRKVREVLVHMPKLLGPYLGPDGW